MIASILIADDDEDFTSILKTFLQGKGHEVRIVGEGLAAAMAVAEEKPHLILLDIQMPGGYGTAVYEVLQRDPAARKIPIIFMSGLLDEERMKQRIPPTPLLRFMVKPVDLEKMHGLMLELLKESGGYTK